MKSHLIARLGPVFLMLASFPAASAPASSGQERGAELLLPMKQTLMATLNEGLAQGQDVAIEVCSIKAPAIASELSQNGVAMGRTSHRLRNPENAGPEWASAVLERYLQVDAELTPQTVALGDGRTGYVEPILTQPLCLACHGSELSPAVEAALDANYPEDNATGFEAGELRGVFWVSFPDETFEP